ncbi:hypothetical protein ABZW11_26360 [Nonomuraea sp. NPDC004580]|uniref:hypothetical protein n=1 Tax=Nonomuraea sp. NPDC004580 TaxID=3154552 RepID=UPI0033A37D04
MSRLPRLTGPAANDELIDQLADSVLNRTTHIHPEPGRGADYHCLNLTSYMGECMAPVLVRLREVTASLRAAEDRTARALALIDEWELGDVIHPSAADHLRRLLAPEGGA